MKIEMGTGLKVAPMKLFCGTSNMTLAEEIASYVGVEIGRAHV